MAPYCLYFIKNFSDIASNTYIRDGKMFNLSLVAILLMYDGGHMVRHVIMRRISELLPLEHTFEAAIKYS